MTAAHQICDWHEMDKVEYSIIVAATASDLRKYCIEGPAGVLSVASRSFCPEYQPSKTRLLWPNGSETHLYSSEKPDRIRGGNYTKAWCDELAHWANPEMVWNMLMLTLRYGVNPQFIVTTTPKPLPLLREISKRPDVVTVRGSTLENRENLAPIFIREILEMYEGTRLGRQEIYGEILEDVEGALWTYEEISQARLSPDDVVPKIFDKIRIGVDPTTTSGPKADSTGIVVVGQDETGTFYILGDHSLKGSPNTWASKVVSVYNLYKSRAKSVCVVAETNQGGEMVSSVIQNVDNLVPIKMVHASVGKVARAEPVHLFYEQKKVKHAGHFVDLEDQMCSFVPGETKKSPDRLDALVWAMTDLGVSKRARAGTWGRAFTAKHTPSRYIRGVA